MFKELGKDIIIPETLTPYKSLNLENVSFLGSRWGLGLRVLGF